MKNDLDQNQRTIAKIVSLLVAILLWARFSGMVEESEATLQQVFSQINVVYDSPESMKVNTSSNYQFQVTLSGPRNQLQQVDTADLLVSLDLNGYEQGSYTLPVNGSNITLPPTLDQLSVVEVAPDQVALNLVEYSTKQLEIQITYEGSPHPDYELVDVILEPKFVTIEGPTDRIKDSVFLFANQINIEGLRRTKEDKITFNFRDQIPIDTVIVEDFQKFRYRAIIREKTEILAPEEAYKVVYDASRGVLVSPDRVRAEIRGPISTIRWIDPSWLRPVIEIPPNFGTSVQGGAESIRVPVSPSWNVPLQLLSLEPTLLRKTMEVQVTWTPENVEVRKP